MPVNTDGPELSGIEHRLTVLETRVDTLVDIVNGLAVTVATKADLDSLRSLQHALVASVATKAELSSFSELYRSELQLLRKEQQVDIYRALYSQMWKLYVYGAGLVGVAFFIGRYVA